MQRTFLIATFILPARRSAAHRSCWTIGGATTRAAGIRVPGAVGDFLILDALQESGGGAIAVPEREIEEMQRVAASHGAGFAGLETSAALAALPALRARRLVDSYERVVVFDTGAGFKSEAPLDLPPPESVGNDPAAWDSVVESRAARALAR